MTFSLLVEIREVAVVWTGQSTSSGRVCTKPHFYPFLHQYSQQEKVVQKQLRASHVPRLVTSVEMTENSARDDY